MSLTEMSAQQPWWEDEPATLEKKEEYDYVLQAFAGQELARGWNRRPCPRCHDMDGKSDHKASLGLLWPDAGYNCFRCSMSGTLPSDYRLRLEDEDPLEQATHGAQASSSAAEEEKPKEVELCEGFMPAFQEPGWSADALSWVRAYLMGKRGLQAQSCYEAGVGAVLAGKLAGRIVVPIPDYQDPSRPWRGWVAREALGRPTSMPYRYAKGMVRIGLLYNEPVLYRETDQPCFIVEGTLDALSLWPDAVAVLGKPLESQLELLVRARRPLAVCLDGDAWGEGQALTWKLRVHGKRAGNVKLPPKTDPDECPRAWLEDEARRML